MTTTAAAFGLACRDLRMVVGEGTSLMVDDEGAADDLPRLVLEQIDRIRDRFETDLQSGRPADPADYLPLLDATAQREAGHELLCQLVALDLDYRWRPDAPHGPSAVRPPKLEDYRARFPQLAELSPERSLALIEAEYQARQLWSDQPDYAEYLSRFPEFGPDLKLALHVRAAELDPTSVIVYLHGTRQGSFALWLPMEIGRQRPGEPGPYQRLRARGKDRLIIARLEETQISRSHVGVELAGGKKLRVINRSASSDVWIDPDGRLDPGEHRRLDRPILLIIGDRVVRLEETYESPDPSR
jgi:hypothetical protein